SRHVKKERLVQPKALPADSLGDADRSGSKSFMIDPMMDHRDAFGGEFPELRDVARGRVANCDDRILSPRKPPRDDATIEHPFPIVFFPDTKCRQIVNRGD